VRGKRVASGTICLEIQSVVDDDGEDGITQVNPKPAKHGARPNLTDRH
jgi:hypothetical protein